MFILQSYATPSLYLISTKHFLMQRELENNLILGLVNGISDAEVENKNFVFINVYDKNILVATSIKTMSKAIVAGINVDKDCIALLVDYYVKHNIDLAGVVGDTQIANDFAQLYFKEINSMRKMIVHQLDEVEKIVNVKGVFEKTSIDHIDLVTEWSHEFQIDAKNFPIHSMEVLYKMNLNRINAGDIYHWLVQDEIVSIACVVRKTENIGIVGLVYTPLRYRGKGYATTCVHALSQKILSDGFKACGLFTDSANSTSNKIYANIGYKPIGEYCDIAFK